MDTSSTPNLQIDPSNIRVRAAKLGQTFKSPALRLLIVFLAIIFILAGLAIVILAKISAGWLIIALATPLIMFLPWSKHALIDPPLHENQGITGLLDTECLTLINQPPTTASLAELIPKTKSGNFFLSRLELHPELLKQLAETLDPDPSNILKKALEIRQTAHSPSVTGAILAVAMIEVYPDHDNLLHRLRLELTDLYQGKSILHWP